MIDNNGVSLNNISSSESFGDTLVLQVSPSENIPEASTPISQISQRKKRMPITLEMVMGELDEMKKMLDNEIEKRRKSLDKHKGTNFLRGIRKRIDRVEKHVPKLKKIRAISKDSKNGLSIPISITQEFSKFLKIDPDEKISRIDGQCALSAYINLKPDESREKILRWKYLNPHNRDLRDVNDKRIIHPNKKLSNLLNYDNYKKDVKKGLIKTNKKNEQIIVTDDKLEYRVVIRLFQIHFKKNLNKK